mgnify:CR=1 FL=1
MDEKEEMIIAGCIILWLVLSAAIYYLCLKLFIPEKAEDIFLYVISGTALTPDFLSPEEAFRVFLAAVVAGIISLIGIIVMVYLLGKFL